MPLITNFKKYAVYGYYTISFYLLYNSIIMIRT